MASPLAKTPLHDWHVAHGGRMVDFAGWSMPVQYSSIVAEHNATRTAAGLFDVSHMGRLYFAESGAAEFLDSLVTRRVSDMEPGQVRYALVTNERGGILDDVLVYHLAEPDGERYHLMVVNASNREKIDAWVKQRMGSRDDVHYIDTTRETAMIAVQGPLALEILLPYIDVHLGGMKNYHALETVIPGHRVVVSRTGYTGEDGFEIIVPASIAAEIWESLFVEGRLRNVMAAGLGAHDTLRLEAAMPLYGHELNEQINPIEAGLNFAVNLEGRQFPGCETLQKVKREGPGRVRVGLELSGKRPAREHYEIYSSDQLIGEVTSGTFSPTLAKPIAMGYVAPQFAAPGTKLEIDIRGTHEPATVVTLPFYRRAK